MTSPLTRALVLAAAMTLAFAGCRGGDDEDADGGRQLKGPSLPTRTPTPTETETATPTPTETPTPTPSVSRAVRYCAPVERFFDITARVATCSEANELLTSGGNRWARIGTSPTDVDRYSCARTERTARNDTIRCTKGDATVRFSLDTRPAPAPPGSQNRDRDREPENTVGVCEKANGWDAITVTNIACPAVKRELRNNTDRLTGARRGATVRLDSGFRCERVDTSDATDPTVRCVNGNRNYHATYVGRPEDPDAVEDEPIEHCAKTDGWDAITAKGVDCGVVEEALDQYGDELRDAKPDDEFDFDTGYECKRLDTDEDEAPTVYCADGEDYYYATYTEAG